MSKDRCRRETRTEKGITLHDGFRSYNMLETEGFSVNQSITDHRSESIFTITQVKYLKSVKYEMCVCNCQESDLVLPSADSVGD